VDTNKTPAERGCNAALVRALDLVGKRWNGLIVSVLIDGPSRFTELGRVLPGISERMLAGRRTELSEAGVVTRTVHTGPPTKVTYAVTPSGKALAPAIAALTRWAEEGLPPAALTRESATELPTDRRLVLHCAGGSRSSVAASLLRREGREDVYDLIGGYTAWAAAPTE
jgi:DNA-binding HxlR family transcriptional regulator